VLTTTTASLFDHAASQPVYATSYTPGVLNLQRGVTSPSQSGLVMSPSGQ
jgi:hypothetical protein